MIRRGDKANGMTQAIFDYLNGAFSANLEKMNQYIDLKDKEEISKGAEKMTGLGQEIYNRARKEGREEGREEMLRKMLSQNTSEEFILSLGYTPEEIDGVKKQLKK